MSEKEIDCFENHHLSFTFKPKIFYPGYLTNKIFTEKGINRD